MPSENSTSGPKKSQSKLEKILKPYHNVQEAFQAVPRVKTQTGNLCQEAPKKNSRLKSKKAKEESRDYLDKMELKHLLDRVNKDKGRFLKNVSLVTHQKY